MDRFGATVLVVMLGTGAGGTFFQPSPLQGR